jgi:hypothetical protein
MFHSFALDRIVMLSYNSRLSLPAAIPPRTRAIAGLGYFSTARQPAESENWYVSETTIILYNVLI